eukprot:IDg12710t1
MALSIENFSVHFVPVACDRLVVPDKPGKSQHSMLAARRARSQIQALSKQILGSSQKTVRLLNASPNENESQPRWALKLPPSVEEARDRAVQTYGVMSAAYSRAAATSYGRLMRLDKPAGAQLLFMPCAWGVAIGATSIGDVVGLSALLYGGAVVARGAGCTVNDIWDADIDRSVERTKDRPVAAGEISAPAAVAFAFGAIPGGIGIVDCAYADSIHIGGAIIGYAAVTDAIALPALALYGSGVCWTMVYDTIYGHQDKRDDRVLGLKSTALEFGDNPRNVLAAFGAGQFAFLFAAGMLTDLSTPFYMGTAVAAMRVYSQIYNTDLDNPKECGKAFADNTSIGALIWGSILAGRIF